MKAVVHKLVLAICFFCVPVGAFCQAFPSGPITVLVPLAPGDAADTASRLMADEMSKVLKTPVLVTNRPGAGGAIAAGSVSQAKKDGQTILFAQNSALTFRPAIRRFVIFRLYKERRGMS